MLSLALLPKIAIAAFAVGKVSVWFDCVGFDRKMERVLLSGFTLVLVSATCEKSSALNHRH
jgi:hypothetical protein